MNNHYPLYETLRASTLRDLFYSAMDRGNEKIAFSEKKESQSEFQGITYFDVKDRVEALATAFCLHKLGPEDRIALISENRIDWALCYLATTVSGGLIVPVDKESKDQEIFHILHRSKAKMIIYSKTYADTIRDIRTNLPQLNFRVNMDLEANHQDEIALPSLIAEGQRHIHEHGTPLWFKEEITKDDLAALLFTSGTTAMPKIVGLTHRNITSNIEAMIAFVGVVTEDIFLSVLPMHHVYECTCGFLCPFGMGCTIAFAQNLRKVAENMNEVQATIMLGVPPLFKALHNRVYSSLQEKVSTRAYLGIGKALGKLSKNKLSRTIFAPVHKKFGGALRFFITGGAAADPQISKGLRMLGFNIYQGYGLTECSPILAVNRPHAFKDQSVGLVLPSCEVMIHQPNEEGIGEIIARGESVITHYHQNPSQDALSFKDGWFYTGDLGTIDDDGFLYVVGRSKNVIVTEAGKNVYPEELEEHLNRSEFILESVVTTKTDPKTKQEQIHAILVPDFEWFDTYCTEQQLPNNEEELHTLLEQEVKKVSDGLADFKRIRGFSIRSEEFDKTSTRKIKRHHI